MSAHRDGDQLPLPTLPCPNHPRLARRSRYDVLQRACYGSLAFYIYVKGIRGTMRILPRPALFLPPLILAFVSLAAACGNSSQAGTEPPSSPTAEATPFVSWELGAELLVDAGPPPLATPTAVPTPAPFVPFTGIVVGGPVTTYQEPTSASAIVGRLGELSTVSVVAEVRGENWIVGDQTWAMAIQDWDTAWYRLEDGSYVYSAFVFLPRAGERSPLDSAGAKSILIDVPAQRASLMVGGSEVYSMRITTGRAPNETPSGQFRVTYRVRNERMTSTQAGINDPNDHYDVQRVLFTQYFAAGGYALHLNYWQPYSVFGGYPSSHGCVGLLLHDAQYLWMWAGSGTPVTVRGGGTAAATPSPSPSATASPTPTATPTAEPTPSPTPEATPSPSATPSPTPSPTATAPSPFG